MDETVRVLLLAINEDLGKNDVKQLLYLCELPTADREDIKDGKSLFLCLEKRDLISEKDLSFLKEILLTIGRKDILRNKLSMDQKEINRLQNSIQHISPYRLLLYDISQNLGTNDVQKLKFLLNANTAKLENTDSSLDVLSEMEKDGSLGKEDLKTLKKHLGHMERKDLVVKIEEFEAKGGEASYLDITLKNMSIQESSSNRQNIHHDASEPGKTLEKYKLDKNPHGYCVILNNEDFEEARARKKDIKNRKGTDKDAVTIKEVFSPRQYVVEEHKDLTSQEMLSVLKKYSQEDHTEKDSFVCFILSHGNLGTVTGVDGEEVLIKDLTRCFNGFNCQSLTGKPKVFFIQACQGDRVDGGVVYERDSSTSCESDNTARLPIYADFLTAFACVEDYMSLRDPQNGSIYIQRLCTALKDPNLAHEDLKNILTIVHNEVAEETYKLKINRTRESVKQMPSFKSELCKALIFPPIS
ncbi:caspase-3-like isoform X1 [Hyperolius riggenbachi]|uniref:caspase-3-like isoform X1 n=1 Tax=Hyperolius riggenbachi TaxID=752182 RepID=UPI0035A2DFB6